MEYIQLKNSEISVSRLCMGGCPMGGHGWGQVDDNELMAAVNTAVDHGISMFDTADVYGLGHSEKLLGQALGGRRKHVVIATKFGVRYENGTSIYDNSPKYIEEAVTGSLKRLGTDYIDIYQIHYRDAVTPINQVVDKLCELRQRGLIRYIGLSNIYEKDIPDLLPYKDEFVSFQDEYSLANRKNEKNMKQISEELKLIPMTWGSLGQGVLSGKYDKNTIFPPDDRRRRDIYENFHGEKYLKNLEIVEVIKELAHRYDKSVPSVAIRFILDYLQNSIVLVGIKNRQQVMSNLEAIDWKLTEEDISRLCKIS